MDVTTAEGMCICPECPTFVDCGEPHAFCMHDGTSSCINAEHGCLCGGCPVHDAESFEFDYYCTQGSEAQIAAS